MRILVFGVTGMLGNAVFRLLSQDATLSVYGTVRHSAANTKFGSELSKNLITDIDVENQDLLVRAFAVARPDAVINCIGIIKQLAAANDILRVLPFNSLLPHRLAALCQLAGACLVHISTDCVFSGAKGNYLETDCPDADDLYGRSKFLGEVSAAHAVTLRTSIIGHELQGQKSLVGWFLAQQGSVKGFTKAIFSGLPTVELAAIIRDIVLRKTGLHGLYHVAAKPISKYDLLKQIAVAYKKNIEIIPDASLVIDRSLNAERFYAATGYVAPEWPALIQKMHDFQ